MKRDLSSLDFGKGSFLLFRLASGIIHLHTGWLYLVSVVEIRGVMRGWQQLQYAQTNKFTFHT